MDGSASKVISNNSPLTMSYAAVVAGWMREVQGERLRAEHELGQTVPGDQLTKEQIRSFVLSLKDIASLLRAADPRLKAEVYAELGVRVTYDPHSRIVSVSAGPCTKARVGGPDYAKPDWRIQPWDKER
jgi:hypothetical protein